jgi:hypothetical protein
MNRPSDDALNAFNEHIDELADEAGVELDDADRQRIFGLSVAGGFSPDSTVQAFGELVDDDYESVDVDDDELGPGAQRLVDDHTTDVEKLESALTRPLSEHELDHLARSSIEQAARHGQIDVAGSLDEYQAQFKTESSRSEFYKQRLAEEPAELDDDRELDLNNQDDRHAFMQARLNGAEFEDAE